MRPADCPAKHLKRPTASALTAQGWPVSATAVGKLLDGLGYRLHALQKVREGAAHPDRNAQFEHIKPRAPHPVISVDTKKKELVGDFKNGGREWQPTGEPERVRVHDFPGDAVGKAIPYGVYGHGAQRSLSERRARPRHAGLRRRIDSPMVDDDGAQAYPVADALYITADAGGSNGYRTRGWKAALQRLADDLRLRIHVSQFPPGTSKWNKVEHRLFCHITQNWCGHATVILNWSEELRTRAAR